MNGNMLTIIKISLVSFICDVIVPLSFPDDSNCDFYSQEKMKKNLPYLLLANTDSAGFQFVFRLRGKFRG